MSQQNKIEHIMVFEDEITDYLDKGYEFAGEVIYKPADGSKHKASGFYRPMVKKTFVQPKIKKLPFKLTPVEKICLQSLLDGKTSKEIASKLNCAKDTVDGYIAMLCAKFGCSRRNKLMLLAMKKGFIVDGELVC